MTDTFAYSTATVLDLLDTDELFANTAIQACGICDLSMEIEG